VLTGFKVSATPVTLLGDFAPIGVMCPRTAKGDCTGTVTIQGQARSLASVGMQPSAKTVRLGRESFAVPRGKTEKVLVALSARAVKAVKRAGKLKVTVMVTARDSAGKRAKPIARAIWLKAAKKPLKKRTPRTSR
jgi:hypothetical protein